MVDERQLSSVLSELANTLATDFPITAILDHLVGRIVGVLPVTAAGVTLIDPGASPRYVAASDESALRFERLQTALGEGPCVLAYESGEAVASADLSVEERFPEFVPAATAAGLGAVFAFPLHHGDRRFGALDLYRDVPGELDAHTMESAQTLANVAAAYLLNAQARDEARSNTENLRHTATHDELTGLPNRLLMQERIDHASRRAQRSHAPAAILFIDLDRFKRVNDTFGHQAGDEVLRAVGERLAQVLRPGDSVARIYGDEFVLLCEDLQDKSDVDVLVERVRTAFAAPFVAAGTELTLTASIGVAFAGPGHQLSQRHLTAADHAMYDAKRSGTGHRVVDVRDTARSDRQPALSKDLQSALARGNLSVAYQPIVRCQDGLLTALELDLRWTHPSQGLISAPSIVAAAEQSGLIGEVGAWSLVSGLRDVATWLNRHPGVRLDLAVRVSSQQVTSRRFLATVAEALEQTGVSPDMLIVEVPEGVLLDAGEPAREALVGLRKLGTRVALSDFGSECRSFGHLHRLPIDIVKFHRSFAATIGRGPKDRAVAAAVTNLAHALDLTVVLEGVETARQRDAAAALGADWAQGSFYAEPLSAADVDALFTTGSPDLIRLPESLDRTRA